MNRPPDSKRTLVARIVLWGVLFLALLNLGRALALWYQADWLIGLSLIPDSRIRLAIALVWATSFWGAFVGLGLRKLWSRKLIPILLLVYGVYELGMMMIFASTPPSVLPILVYFLFVVLAAWHLWRPPASSSFRAQ